MSAENVALPHQMILDERKRLTVSGVSDVDSFDDALIIAYTSLGELTVKGTALHISRLNVDTGELSVEGTITSLEYTDPRPKTKGLFGKLFK